MTKLQIRPAATLLLIRDGQSGIEVLALKRSAAMRFLPGHIAFPGGTLDPEDWEVWHSVSESSVLNQCCTDDVAYAAGALRECAEEVGWACAVNGAFGMEELQLSAQEQDDLLQNRIEYASWLSSNGQRMAFGCLRFVGRWVTPAHMPVRFDTRFFVYNVQSALLEPVVNLAENDWAKWVNPAKLLEEIKNGETQAVPPTIAMLQALTHFDSVQACLEEMEVPGPPPEDSSALGDR